jgi:hypothetical protein
MLKTTKIKILVVTISMVEVGTRVARKHGAPMSKKNGTAKKAKTPKVTFGEDGSVSITGLPKDPAKRAAALEHVVEQLTGHISDQTRTITGLRSDFEGAMKELRLQQERNTQDAKAAQRKYAQLEIKHQTEERRRKALGLMSENFRVLSQHFDGIVIQQCQLSDRFGNYAAVEAGNLLFNFVQSTAVPNQIAMQSTDGAPVELCSVVLDLNDNGTIGPKALGQIKLYQEAVTPEGKQRLVKVLGNEAKDLFPAPAKEPVQEVLRFKRPRLLGDDPRTSAAVRDTLDVLKPRQGRHDLPVQFADYGKLLQHIDDTTLSSGPSNKARTPLCNGLVFIVNDGERDDSSSGDGRPYGIIPTTAPGTSQSTTDQ